MISLGRARSFGCRLALWAMLAIAFPPASWADESAGALNARQPLEDAWWTGPLLAASPATLPQGHVLVEPYLYEATANEEFDNGGVRRSIAKQRDCGSLSYLLYGLTDSVTVGVIPRFAYDNPSQASDVLLGDLTGQVSFRLSQYLDYGWLPALALVIGETFPTGKYDRLSNPNDGVGAGNYVTSLSLYGQYYLWMPNGRILRARINLTRAWSGNATIEDSSVYSTRPGFHGHASGGDSSNIDLAWEYSFTRHWVAALDIVYGEVGSVRLMGQYSTLKGESAPTRVDERSEASNSTAVAPAFEYNWTGNAGIIVGAKIVVSGRNTAAAIVPVMAINLVF